MPVIDGMKFSCAPCMRGHRATTCMHHDRILLEVRRPGRPLSSCPHKSQSCGCRPEELLPRMIKSKAGVRYRKIEKKPTKEATKHTPLNECERRAIDTIRNMNCGRNPTFGNSDLHARGVEQNALSRGRRPSIQELLMPTSESPPVYNAPTGNSLPSSSSHPPFNIAEISSNSKLQARSEILNPLSLNTINSSTSIRFMGPQHPEFVPQTVSKQYTDCLHYSQDQYFGTFNEVPKSVAPLRAAMQSRQLPSPFVHASRAGYVWQYSDVGLVPMADIRCGRR